MPDQTPQEIEESRIVRAAEVQLHILDNLVEKAMRPWKTAVRFLTGVVIALAIGAGVSGFLYANQASITQAVAVEAQAIRNGAITTCEQQNVRSLASTANWDYFIGILAKGDTKPADLAEAKAIEAHIAAVNAPKDCTKLYGK